MNNYLKSKKGFVSIEAVISMVAVIFVVLLAIGFFGYMHPKIMFEKDVQILAQKAKVQGGLTDETSEPGGNSDIEIFKKSLEDRGFDVSKVEITAKTKPGNYSVIGVTPLNSSGNNYLKRDSKELMVITAKIPANRGGLMAPLKFFGIVGGLNEYYCISEAVMSERW